MPQAPYVPAKTRYLPHKLIFGRSWNGNWRSTSCANGVGPLIGDYEAVNPRDGSKDGSRKEWVLSAMLLDRFLFPPSSLASSSPSTVYCCYVGLAGRRRWRVFTRGENTANLYQAQTPKYLSIFSTSQCIGSVGVIYFFIFCYFFDKVVGLSNTT